MSGELINESFMIKSGDTIPILFATGMLPPMMVEVCKNPWFAWSLNECV